MDDSIFAATEDGVNATFTSAMGSVNIVSTDPIGSTTNVNLRSTATMKEVLLDANGENPLTEQKVKRFKDFVRNLRGLPGMIFNRSMYITEEAQEILQVRFLAANMQDMSMDKLDKWPDDRFFAVLEMMLDEKGLGLATDAAGFRLHFRLIKFQFDPTQGMRTIDSYVLAVNKVEKHRVALGVLFPEAQAKEIIHDLMENFSSDRTTQELKSKICANGKPVAIHTFLGLVIVHGKAMIQTYHDAQRNGFLVSPVVNSSTVASASNRPSKWNKHADKNTKRHSSESQRGSSNKSSATPSATPSVTCDACGRPNHARATCGFVSKNHPDVNTSTDPWSVSESGRAWKSQRGKDYIDWHQASIKPGYTPLPSSAKKQKTSHSSHKKGELSESLALIVEDKDLTAQSDYTYTLIPTTITYNNFHTPIESLIDTGARHGNYINRDLAATLAAQGRVARKCKSLICDVFGNYSRDCHNSYDFSITLLNEVNNDEYILDILAKVIDSPYDLILGLPTIKKYALLDKFSYKYIDCDATILNTTSIVTQNSPLTELHTRGKDGAVPSPSDSGKPGSHDPGVDCISWDTTRQCHHDAESYIKTNEMIRPKSDFLTFEEVADDMFESFMGRTSGTLCETIPPQHADPQTELLSHIRMDGSDYLKEGLTHLVIEYADIFASELDTTHANLPPMTLRVDDAKWEIPSNHQGPRTQSPIKEQEILKHIDKLERQARIVKCMEPYYSQVHMARKPNSDPPTFRFCLDFRPLNWATSNTDWPLPLIDQMLRRLGERKGQYFCTLDMTSGYHQVPLSLESQRYTAFITFLGIYMWQTIPFGLKGAPAYFQQLISTIVLAGLIYLTCELYIDDIVVHAQTEDELLHNLREIFSRFRHYNLKLSPKKCVLGVSQIEYVGHTLSSAGISFSQKKRDFVVDFQRPISAKDMKSFLGVANYFSTHIRNFSIITKPLRDMIPNYTVQTSRRRLKWTEDQTRIFHEVKQAINDCPTLYFVRQNLSVFLETDASDYGIGGYLYQVDSRGTQYPIAFISKSLTPQEKRWDTRDKEAFAIFYSIYKLEYLLRDIHFTLKTDHKNLTYINHDYQARVLRWKLALQEYSFDVYHIPGKDNVVADAFSRMIPNYSNFDNSLINSPSVSSIEPILVLDEEFTIPPIYRDHIKQCHNTLVGHGGVERTLTFLRRKNLTWKYQREHVRRFIKLCPCCQKMSFLRIPIEASRFTCSASCSWERLAVDTIGRMMLVTLILS